MEYYELARQLIKELQTYHRVHSYNQINEKQRGEKLTLRLLDEHGQLKPGELSQLMRLTSARVATILNRLEQKELVIREADLDDRRSVQVTLTEKGKEVNRQTQKEQEDGLVEILKSLGLEDARELVRLHAKLSKIFCQERKEEMDDQFIS